MRHPVEGPLVGDEAGHTHFVASFTHRTTDRLRPPMFNLSSSDGFGVSRQGVWVGLGRVVGVAGQ